MTAERFDYSPLGAGVGVKDRLRSMGASSRLTIGATVAVLLLVVPLIALGAMVAVGNRDWGAYAFVAMLLGCGAYTSYDVLRQAQQAAGLAAFARANHLLYIRAAMAPQYAGSLFAQELVGVGEAVRTTDRHFIEVGDQWSMSNPHPREVRRPQLYLRLRVSGPSDLPEALPAALARRLHEFAGEYTIEFAPGELTVFGTRPLDALRSGRIREAFELCDQLSVLAGVHNAPPVETVPVAANHVAASDGSRFGPAKVVALTLAMLIVVPLLMAIVLSILGDELHGNWAAGKFVAGLVATVALAIVGATVRFMARRNNDSG